MKAKVDIVTAAAQDFIYDTIEETSYFMIAAAEVHGSSNGKSNKSKPNSAIQNERRLNAFFLVLVSFIAGSIFGGSMVKLHSDSLATKALQFADEPTTFDGKNLDKNAKSGCELTDNDIKLLCGTDAGTPKTIALLGKMTETIKAKAREELEAERKSLEPPLRHPSYCPLATCVTTDLCAPCQRRFLIIITTPRSASTTLTWMFDYLPGVRMAGENNNTLAYLKSATDNIVKSKEFRFQANTRTSWGHRFMPNQTLACMNQKMIESISPPPLKPGGKFVAQKNHTNDIVGFKTIRFFKETKTKVEQRDMVKYLITNFPCSRVVININSDVASQVKSIDRNFHGTKTKNQTQYILDENEKLRWLAKVMGSQRAFLLDKDQWTKNISNLNEVVSWLGFDDTCHYSELLEFNVGGYGTGKTKMVRKRNCKRL